MEDTIAILRGLKERYEVHHGVRIRDSALVAAAQLSDRYITDRFLPDKVRASEGSGVRFGAQVEGWARVGVGVEGGRRGSVSGSGALTLRHFLVWSYPLVSRPSTWWTKRPPSSTSRSPPSLR